VPENETRHFKPSWWVLLALGMLAIQAAYGDVARFRNPDGEKIVTVFQPGQNDFAYAYVSARALVSGVNPYRNNRPEFTDPFYRYWVVNGEIYKQLYPPAHILLYTPLAWWKQADWQGAGRVWFHVSLLALVGLAALVWSILRRVTEAPLSRMWIPFFLVCMMFNSAVELGLERGQSDIFSSLLGWTAVWCFLRNQRGRSVFLAICGAALKAYLVPFAAGLCLLGWRRGSRRAVVIGVLAALALTILPAARYYPDGMRAMVYRSDMFWADLHNQGFLNAVFQINPAWAPTGRRLLTAFAFIVSVMAWIQARRAFRRGLLPQKALWLTVFAMTSLILMIGYSALSTSYNLILLLPGALILMVAQRALVRSRWTAHIAGLILAGVAFTFGRIHTGVLPTSWAIVGYGYVGMLLVFTGVLGHALFRPLDWAGAS
jgi:hypothetical protein